MIEKKSAYILLVESDKDYAQFVMDTLAKSPYFDYHITYAETLTGAKRILQCQRFDIVIMAMVLVNGEGPGIVQEVRDLAPKEETTLIVITKFGNEAKELEMRLMLANDYLDKNILTEERLLSCIRNWAIYRVGSREGKKGMGWLDEVGKKIDDTMEACESSITLPPFE